MRLFLVHDGGFFYDRLSPALVGCVRDRSFAPLAELVEAVTPRVEIVAIRDCLTADERPMFLHLDLLRFDRRIWRHVAGELLLYTAIETPSFPLAPELLGRFMNAELVDRLHRGSREVSFAGVPYRPGAAGVHDVGDVAELATSLTDIDPNAWSTDTLVDLPPDERDEDMEYARQRFGNLRSMFASANAKSQVIVCEEV